MDDEKVGDQFRALTSEFIPYLQSRLDLTKADATARIGKLIFVVLSLAIVGLIFMLGILVASLGLAFMIGRQLAQLDYGFFIIAVAYVVVGTLIYLLRSKLIYPFAMNLVINLVYDEDEEEDEEDDD